MTEEITVYETGEATTAVVTDDERLANAPRALVDAVNRIKGDRDRFKAEILELIKLGSTSSEKGRLR